MELVIKKPKVQHFSIDVVLSSPSDLVKGLGGRWPLANLQFFNGAMRMGSVARSCSLTLSLHGRGGVDVARTSLRVVRVLHIYSAAE